MEKLALLVPIRLDFCFTSENNDHAQEPAHADFSKLPYPGAPEGHHTPFLTEAILHNPFESNRSDAAESPHHRLATGMHLHWALPTALTQGQQQTGSTEVSYPVVPNRWLVRIKKSSTDYLWVIESDYLHPIGQEVGDSRAYPVTAQDIAFGATPSEAEKEQPFRYLGRARRVPGDSDTWQYDEDTQADRLKRLTAVGYGDPGFAAYYPNCPNVFGFHYGDVLTKSELEDVSIVQVAGWYADVDNDPVHQLVKELGNASGEELMAEIQRRLGWANGEGLRKDRHGKPLQEGQLHQTIFFAERKVHINGSIANKPRLDRHRISIGHSGTEALGALLHHIDAQTNPKTELETQLAYSLLNPRWEGSQLDVWDRFLAEQHQQRFTALPGETYWGLKTNSPDNIQVPGWLQLPEQLVTALYLLNEQWVQHQQALHNREYHQHLLFAAWGKYLIAKYDADQGHHDPNVIQTQMRSLMEAIGEDPAAMAEAPLAHLSQALQAYREGQPAPATVDWGIPASQIALSTPWQQEQALPSGLSILGTGQAPVWEEGFPLVSRCLRLPAQGYLAAMAQQPTRTLSCWVKLDDSPETSFFPIQIADTPAGEEYWDHLEINGQPREEPLALATLRFPTEQWVHVYMVLRNTLPAGTPLYVLGDGAGESLGGAVAGLRLYTQALSESQKAWDHNMLGQHQVELHQTPGPQYYRPTDPVLLLEGEGLISHPRHYEEHWYDEAHGDLYCFLQPNIWDAQGKLLLHNINMRMHEVIDQQQKWIDDKDLGHKPIGKHGWKTQPWNPTWLEWEVAYYPYQQGHNQSSSSRLFSPDFFQANGTLGVDHPDWEAMADMPLGQPTTYRGRSLLSASAKHSLLRRLYEELHQTLAQHGQAADTAVAAYQPQYTKDKVTQDLQHFEQEIHRCLSEEPDSVTRYYLALIDAGRTLANTSVMAQSMGTLHAAMKMHRGGLHAPIADPLGDPDFAQAVEACLADYLHRQSAMPEGDFHPLRHGFLRIQGLRILDNFGKIKNLEFQGSGQDTLIRAASLVPKQTPEGLDPQRDLWLPPRVLQASRLHFRWLDAHHPQHDLSTYPDSHPVIGWLMHDPMGQYLALYDGAGAPLGRISPVGEWLAFPGEATPRGMGDISPELRAVIEPLLAGTQELHSLICQAVDTLDPEATAYADGWERLLGHPLALVRARVDLHLQHAPLADHHWQTTQPDLAIRETDGFEHVTVPLKLGAPDRVNDGLVGYWLADAEGKLSACYTPYAEHSGDFVQTEDPQRPPVSLRADPAAAAQTLTLLLDPYSAVHLTTGVLPVKSISIPQKAFEDTLHRISTAFFRTRVLTSDQAMALPYSQDDGHEWTWLQQQRHTWTQRSERGVVARSALQAAFPQADHAALWQVLISQNWIRPLSTHQATLVPTDQRQQQTLPGFEALEARVHHCLLRGQLYLPTTQTSFPDDLVIKEGWLRLSPKQDPNA